MIKSSCDRRTNGYLFTNDQIPTNRIASFSVKDKEPIAAQCQKSWFNNLSLELVIRHLSKYYLSKKEISILVSGGEKNLQEILKDLRSNDNAWEYLGNETGSAWNKDSLLIHKLVKPTKSCSFEYKLKEYNIPDHKAEKELSEFAKDLSALSNTLQSSYLIFGLHENYCIPECFFGLEENERNLFKWFNPNGIGFNDSFREIISKYLPEGLPEVEYADVQYRGKIFSCIRIQSHRLLPAVSIKDKEPYFFQRKPDSNGEIKLHSIHHALFRKADEPSNIDLLSRLEEEITGEKDDPLVWIRFSGSTDFSEEADLSDKASCVFDFVQSETERKAIPCRYPESRCIEYKDYEKQMEEPFWVTFPITEVTSLGPLVSKQWPNPGIVKVRPLLVIFLPDVSFDNIYYIKWISKMVKKIYLSFTCARIYVILPFVWELIFECYDIKLKSTSLKMVTLVPACPKLCASILGEKKNISWLEKYRVVDVLAFRNLPKENQQEQEYLRGGQWKWTDDAQMIVNENMVDAWLRSLEKGKMFTILHLPGTGGSSYLVKLALNACHTFGSPYFISNPTSKTMKKVMEILKLRQSWFLVCDKPSVDVWQFLVEQATINKFMCLSTMGFLPSKVEKRKASLLDLVPSASVIFQEVPVPTTNVAGILKDQYFSASKKYWKMNDKTKENLMETFCNKATIYLPFSLSFCAFHKDHLNPSTFIEAMISESVADDLQKLSVIALLNGIKRSYINNKAWKTLTEVAIRHPCKELLYESSGFGHREIKFWHSRLAELFLERVKENSPNEVLAGFEWFCKNMDNYPIENLQSQKTAKATPLIYSLRQMCKTSDLADRLITILCELLMPVELDPPNTHDQVLLAILALHFFRKLKSKKYGDWAKAIIEQCEQSVNVATLHATILFTITNPKCSYEAYLLEQKLRNMLDQYHNSKFVQSQYPYFVGSLLAKFPELGTAQFVRTALLWQFSLTTQHPTHKYAGSERLHQLATLVPEDTNAYSWEHLILDIFRDPTRTDLSEKYSRYLKDCSDFNSLILKRHYFLLKQPVEPEYPHTVCVPPETKGNWIPLLKSRNIYWILTTNGWSLLADWFNNNAISIAYFSIYGIDHIRCSNLNIVVDVSSAELIETL